MAVARDNRPEDTIHEIIVLNLGDLFIDPRYQRKPAQSLVRKIATTFDDESAGYLLVNIRDDGTLALVDGQHRMLAMRKRGIKQWQCQVTYGLSIAEEAALYKNRNVNIKRARALETFRAGLIVGEEMPLAINGILTELGLTIPSTLGSHSPKYINAVGALQKIYTRHGREFLRDVLTLVMETWPNNQGAFAQVILLGVEAFLVKYPQYQRERFVKKIGRADPVDITTKARMIGRITGGGREQFVLRDALRSLYNESLRYDRRLPEDD